MKFTWSWLKEYLDTDASLQDVLLKLTDLGLEVESVHDKSVELAPFVVAEIVDAQPHPDAEKLRVCTVRTAKDDRIVVCGAPNARAGIKVVLADIGVMIPRDGFCIKKAKIRGVESNGMMCSASELGLSGDAEGIIELPSDAVVGSSIIDVIAGLKDAVIEIAITPNRGDCLGVYGIARDLAAAGVGVLKPLNIKDNVINAKSSLSICIKTNKCGLFSGRLMKKIKNVESPEWLRDRLIAVGLRPISALVDITNYFSIAYGRPLHVYDASKVSGGITVRESKEKEKIQCLNGNSYELTSGLCVIVDDASVLGIAGVIGGEPSGCTLETTDVFIESAWFEPSAVMQSGRALSIDSDARYRFERGVDPQFVIPALEMATHVINELCGTSSTEISEIVTAGAVPDKTRTITMCADDIAALGGISLPEADAIAILQRLGFQVKAGHGEWSVTTPSWRPDMEGRADVVEEVLRVHGYHNIPEVPLPAMSVPLVSEDVNSETCRVRAAQRVLALRGMLGVCHFAFVDRESAERFQADATLVEVINPISADLSVLRPSLIPALLQSTQRNSDRGIKDIALYEVGGVFKGIGSENQYNMAVGVRAGSTPAHWQEKPRPVDVFDVKADMLAVLAALGMDTDKLKVTTEGLPAWYHAGKSGRIALGKLTIAVFGVLHPAWLRKYGLETEVAAFEVYVDNVPKKRNKGEATALKVSDFQVTKRDFAFVVDASLPAGELMSAMRGAEKTLLRDVQLFDVYAGKGVPEGKKSLAISVWLQADDRTLSEDDITRVTNALLAAAKKTGAELR